MSADLGKVGSEQTPPAHDKGPIMRQNQGLTKRRAGAITVGPAASMLAEPGRADHPDGLRLGLDRPAARSADRAEMDGFAGIRVEGHASSAGARPV
jgi:hypothetical protein